MSYNEKKVLVVEDDDMLRGIIAAQLALSFNIATAANGEEALEKLKFWRPDVMVLDLLLPKLDGFTVLERLRAMDDPVLAQTPVIVVSNLRDLDSIQAAKNYGIIEYFTKSDISMGTVSNRITQIFKEQDNLT